MLPCEYVFAIDFIFVVLSLSPKKFKKYRMRNMWKFEYVKVQNSKLILSTKKENNVYIEKLQNQKIKGVLSNLYSYSI